MPADETLKREIQSRLATFASQPLRDAGAAFWKTLGYTSQRALALRGKADFRQHFDSANLLNEKLAHWREWLEVEFLFQLTDDDNRIHASVTKLRAGMRATLKRFWEDTRAVLSLIGRQWLHVELNASHGTEVSCY